MRVAQDCVAAYSGPPCGTLLQSLLTSPFNPDLPAVCRQPYGLSEKAVAMGCAGRFVPGIRISCHGAPPTSVCRLSLRKAAGQSKQGAPEIRSTLFRTWGTRPVPSTVGFGKTCALSALCALSANYTGRELLRHVGLDPSLEATIVGMGKYLLGGQGLQGERAGIDRGG